MRSHFWPFTDVLRKIFGSLTREVGLRRAERPRIRLRQGYGVTGYADVTDKGVLASTVAIPLTEHVKPIRLSKHALDYAQKRRFTIAEVEEAIRTTSWNPAELGRLDCRKDFAYAKEWNSRFYATKQVRPVFVEEETEIVVITVYIYYF